MMTLKQNILQELDALIADGQRLEESFTIREMGLKDSSIPEIEFQSFAIAARAAIERIAGKTSEFYAALPQKLGTQLCTAGYGGTKTSAIIGSLIALRKAVDQGLLVSLESRLRANVYDDFLVQAETLLKANYHVAAIVLISGVLEDHLRKLCDSRALTWKGAGSLSAYNDTLYAASIYAKPVLSRIQAIAHVRNEAAHGNGAVVKRDDVDDALTYVRRFLTDYLA